MTGITTMLKSVSTSDCNEGEKKELMQRNYLGMLMLFSNEWIQTLIDGDDLRSKFEKAGVPTTLMEKPFLSILKDEGENGFRHLWFKTLVETNEETSSTLKKMLEIKLQKLSKENRDYFERIANEIPPRILESLKEEKKVSDMFIKSKTGILATNFESTVRP